MVKSSKTHQSKYWADKQKRFTRLKKTQSFKKNVGRAKAVAGGARAVGRWAQTDHGKKTVGGLVGKLPAKHQGWLNKTWGRAKTAYGVAKTVAGTNTGKAMIRLAKEGCQKNPTCKGAMQTARHVASVF